MALLAVDHAASDDAVVVRVKGDVDSSTVDELTAHLSAALKLAAKHPARLLVVALTVSSLLGCRVPRCHGRPPGDPSQ